MNPFLSIPYDKALHSIAGSVTSLLPLLGILWGLHPSWWVPLCAAAIAGALKEAYDSCHQDRHTLDVWDFVATSLGGIPVALTVLVL